MLTGHNPTSSPFALPPARVVNPALSPQVEEVLLRATARAPRDRFTMVEDFCTALRRAIEAPTVPVLAPTGPTIPIGLPPRPEPAARPLRVEPASRAPWTPTPRTLPEPPRQGGLARGLLLLLLVCMLLASLAGGGWLMSDQLQAVVGAFTQPRQTELPSLSLPGTVVYVAPTEGGGSDVFVRTGTRVEQITNHPPGRDASLPAISPDGKQIAYGVYAGGQETLWVVNRDGSGRRQLLQDYAVARAPNWSPDGTRLAVEIAREPQDAFAQHDIAELELGTEVVRPLAVTDGWEGGPAWSPDGQRIVFNGLPKGEQCMRVYLLDLPDGTPVALSALPDRAQCIRGNGDFWPTWSPDGSRIAFGRKIGNIDRIAVMEVVSGTTEVWNTGAAPAGHPRWSPDGRYLLFEEQPAGKATTLARLHLDTGNVEPIDPNRAASLADWR